MKVLIVPDKFKGSCSAKAVCLAIQDGILLQSKNIQCQMIPLADGGEGSLEIIEDYLGASRVYQMVEDPLGRMINTSYITSDEVAYIELSTASGLSLLKPSEQNPMLTSTIGTGRLIADAMAKGAKEIVLFIGGSATNDAAMGISQALGFKFFSEDNLELQPIGNSLNLIERIERPKASKFDNVRFTVLCDVVNPFFGPSGAAHIYAQQKGASQVEIELLDQGLRNLSRVITEQLGVDISEVPGSGAAGGVGGGMMGLLNAELSSGIEAILEMLNIDTKVAESDHVISGEGRLDHQSLSGKVIAGVLKICQKHQRPLTLLVGQSNLSNQRLDGVEIDCVSKYAKNMDDAMINAEYYLRKMASKLSEKIDT